MEMRIERYGTKKLLRILLCTLMFCFIVAALQAQSVKSCTIKDGRMYIALGKNITDNQLDDFVSKFDLHDLALKMAIRQNTMDSLKKLNWRIDINNNEILIISKKLAGVENTSPADKIIFTDKGMGEINGFPAVSKAVVFGNNRFRNKSPFASRDSTVSFFMRNNFKARRVVLSGSFNNWMPDALAMTRTDSGWTAKIKLGPGKYWYKFVVDGNWTTDNDNLLSENDGRGNVNSVFYKTNVLFRLNGFGEAKNVYLAGSFNNWQGDQRPVFRKPAGQQLPMQKTPTGWELPLYLANGTHTYRFVVDGKWIVDPANTERLPNEFNEFNSVIRLGNAHLFTLNGFTGAKQVVLSGTFNGWKKNELLMKKTAAGWQLPYTLDPGNYEYRFLVDEKWVSDPSDNNTNGQGNSVLVIEPNYRFRLKGYSAAKQVSVSGDFNNWTPGAFVMKKEGDAWVLRMHLSPGKHTYKFVIDGKTWIKDPGNDQWEENEFGTGNSVIWVEATNK